MVLLRASNALHFISLGPREKRGGAGKTVFLKMKGAWVRGALSLSPDALPASECGPVVRDFGSGRKPGPDCGPAVRRFRRQAQAEDPQFGQGRFLVLSGSRIGVLYDDGPRGRMISRRPVPGAMRGRGPDLGLCEQADSAPPGWGAKGPGGALRGPGESYNPPDPCPKTPVFPPWGPKSYNTPDRRPGRRRCPALLRLRAAPRSAPRAALDENGRRADGNRSKYRSENPVVAGNGRLSFSLRLFYRGKRRAAPLARVPRAAAANGSARFDLRRLAAYQRLSATAP